MTERKWKVKKKEEAKKFSRAKDEQKNFKPTHYRWNFPDKMKTGVSNNNNNNKHYSDKFQVIESISERNNNNSSPSIDILSYSNISNISNNNVYADIADLDGTETHSLMYSQNVSQQPPQQQWGRHDRALSSSSRRQLDDPSFYVTNSTSRSVHSSYGKNIWIKIHLSLSLSDFFALIISSFLLLFSTSLLLFALLPLRASRVASERRHSYLITLPLFQPRGFPSFLCSPLKWRFSLLIIQFWILLIAWMMTEWIRIVTFTRFVIQFHAGLPAISHLSFALMIKKITQERRQSHKKRKRDERWKLRGHAVSSSRREGKKKVKRTYTKVESSNYANCEKISI